MIPALLTSTSIRPQAATRRCDGALDLVDPAAVGSHGQGLCPLLPQRFGALLHAVGVDIDQHQVGAAQT